MPPTPLRAAAPALLLLVARLAGATTAANVCTGDPCELRTAIRVTANSVLDFGTGTFRILESGRLDVDAGDTLTIRAGTLLMERGALIRMTPGGTVGPRVLVDTTGAITLKRTGLSRARIDVNGSDGGGEISLIADGNVTVDGDLAAQATTVAGDGGEVTITAGGDATVNGSITVDGGGDGIAGDLAITAARALVTGAGGFAAVQSFSARSGISGGTITLAAGGSSSVGTRLDANGFGVDGDGGDISLEAVGNLTLTQEVSSDGGGAGGSGSGGSIEFRGGGTVRLDARVSSSGGPSNGTGGTIDAFAGLDLLISQPLVAVGTDGTGGSIALDAGRLVRLSALVDVHGGGADAGGDVAVGSGESIEVPGGVNANGGTAGNIDLSTRTSAPPGLVVGGPVAVTGSLVARGNAPGIARSIRLEGCDVSVAASGALTTGGTPPLGILLQGSGQITVAGQLEALPGGTIRFQHRDPAKVPVVTRAPSPPAATTLVTALIPCRGTVVPPVCGNGTREIGEACDDDNTTACDGCSATCTVEACGNGTRECSEGCDDNNLVSGDGLRRQLPTDGLRQRRPHHRRGVRRRQPDRRRRVQRRLPHRGAARLRQQRPRPRRAVRRRERRRLRRLLAHVRPRDVRQQPRRMHRALRRRQRDELRRLRRRLPPRGLRRRGPRVQRGVRPGDGERHAGVRVHRELRALRARRGPELPLPRGRRLPSPRALRGCGVRGRPLRERPASRLRRREPVQRRGDVHRRASAALRPRPHARTATSVRATSATRRPAPAATSPVPGPTGCAAASSASTRSWRAAACDRRSTAGSRASRRRSGRSSPRPRRRPGAPRGNAMRRSPRSSRRSAGW